MQERKFEPISRSSSGPLDEILGHSFEVLDEGFIRLVDYMGDQDAIVQAARVSYGKGTKRARDDVALLRYLLRHRHTTPFEMCEVKLHVKLPIFVARQWIRHRTANVNEYSARYSVLSREFYIPEVWQVQAQSGMNRQGRAGQLPQPVVRDFCRDVGHSANAQFDLYEAALESGVARELARVVLPLSAYTEWYWKVDLHNLLHFLSLRCDAHAQPEIRSYADAIFEEILSRWVPDVTSAFEDYVLRALRLTRWDVLALQHLAAGGSLDDFGDFPTLREREEFLVKLARINGEGS